MRDETEVREEALRDAGNMGKEALSMTSGQQQDLQVHIRWMIRRDMPEVLAIENESFEFPWCEDDFIRCLQQRNCIGMVAEHEDRVVGFMIYELHKTELQVLNLAVSGAVMPNLLENLIARRRRSRKDP